jgi:hypothetical protein
MPFCEKAFGIFFVLWGTLLIASGAFSYLVVVGLFHARLESYLPTWAWGSVMVVIGIGRYLAFRLDHRSSRIRFSAGTVIMLTLIAASAVASGLWITTAPPTIFLAFVSYWCHIALLRDMRLGL